MEQQTEKLKMKELPESERPYEKCEQTGPEALSDAELLAVLLQTGTKTETAVALATRVLAHSTEKNLAGLAKLSYTDLTRIHGIGRVKAVKLLCAAELSRRIARCSFGKRPVFTDPASIADYYMQSLRFLKVEHVYILFFNTRCIFLGEKHLTVGTVNSSLISPREIFIEAVHREAVSIIMVHNHPSGDPEASREDMMLTTRIAQAGKLLDIHLLDHVIIGDNCYLSFREKGYL